MQYADCTIISLSRSGVAVVFDLSDLLPKEATIFLDIILPVTFEQVTLRGQLKRVYLKNNKVVGGIKLDKILPVQLFWKLLAWDSGHPQHKGCSVK